jgi:3-oxoacyl-[acyl-carrier protein] reductase
MWDGLNHRSDGFVRACLRATGNSPSTGIGAGIAKAMSAAGASVVVNFASDRPGAERVVADIKAAGGNAFAAQANVSVVAEVEHLCAEAVATFGPLDILVNNASVFAFAFPRRTA